MDKLTHYREAVKKLVTQYAQEDSADEEIEVQLILDSERDHYQWMNVGWQNTTRIYRCILHLDIRDNKVWLQQNLTDQNPAEDLLDLGVEREDIVLGLHPPYKRPYTDYGVA